MKFILTLFAFFTLSISHCQYRDSYGFPLYEEVLTYLDKNIDRQCESCAYGLAKKVDGYYLVLKEIDQGEFVSRTFLKVWDAKENKFLDPTTNKEFLKRTEKGESSLEDLLNEATRYDLFRIYGYPEWIDDLSQLLSSREELSLKEMEMLARANSEKASDYIHPNQYGNNFSFSKGFTDPMYEKIDPARVDMFIEYANKSLDYYLQIQAKDPNYKPIIIDDLQLKIDHDLMHYFEYLMSVKEPEKARTFLDRVHYNDGYLTYASSILNTCPENAILITYGDTDSYPIWYLQEKDGYRKDVTVLNNSLMQTAWYMTMAKERFGLNTSFTSEQYRLFHREYFLLDASNDPISFKEWVPLIQPALDLAVKNRNGGPAHDESTIPTIPLSVKINYRNSEIVITPNNYYMMMLDLAMIDVMGSNPKRTVISTSPTGFYDLNLHKNFASRSSSYEMLPSETENYTDERTAEWILEKIQLFSPLLFDQMGSVGNRELSALYDNVARISSDAKLQQTLFKKLRSTYSQEYLFGKNDPELIQSLEESYDFIDPELAEQFRSAYSAIALKQIASLEFGGPNPGKTMYELELLFRIYSGADYNMTPGNVGSLNETDKKVLKAIQKKIADIKRDSSVAKMKWISQRLDTIEAQLGRIDL